MMTTTTTIDEMLTELSDLGYQYVTITSHGMEYPTLPDWRASAVPSVTDWRQPTGEGDTPTAAVRACLDALSAAEGVAS